MVFTNRITNYFEFGNLGIVMLRQQVLKSEELLNASVTLKILK